MIKLFNNLSRTFASGLTGIDDLSRVDANPLLALLGLYFPNDNAYLFDNWSGLYSRGLAPFCIESLDGMYREIFYIDLGRKRLDFQDAPLFDSVNNTSDTISWPIRFNWSEIPCRVFSTMPAELLEIACHGYAHRNRDGSAFDLYLPAMRLDVSNGSDETAITVSLRANGACPAHFRFRADGIPPNGTTQLVNSGQFVDVNGAPVVFPTFGAGGLKLWEIEGVVDLTTTTATITRDTRIAA